MLVYVCSPYTNDNFEIMVKRYKAVKYYIGLCHLQNTRKVFYSPIAYYHEIAIEHNLPHNADYWENIDKVMIDACAYIEVLKLPQWEHSHGINDLEIPYALSLGKQVKFVKPAEIVLAQLK